MTDSLRRPYKRVGSHGHPRTKADLGTQTRPGSEGGVQCVRIIRTPSHERPVRRYPKTDPKRWTASGRACGAVTARSTATTVDDPDDIQAGQPGRALQTRAAESPQRPATTSTRSLIPPRRRTSADPTGGPATHYHPDQRTGHRVASSRDREWLHHVTAGGFIAWRSTEAGG